MASTKFWSILDIYYFELDYQLSNPIPFFLVILCILCSGWRWEGGGRGRNARDRSLYVPGLLYCIQSTDGRTFIKVMGERGWEILSSQKCFSLIAYA